MQNTDPNQRGSVVHLATVDCVGGAARSAFRLHQGLLHEGLKSAMLVKEKKSDLPSVEAAIPTSPPPQKAQEFLWTLIQKHSIDQHRSSLSNSFFSTGYPGWELSGHPAVQSADILHLHWVSGFLSPPALARLLALDKPIVWTLHDQRAFTGGCHFSAGCRRYETDCRECPQLQPNQFNLPNINLADQLTMLPGRRFTVVSPSRWLADCARRSALFRRTRVECIPYGIDTDAFRPVPKEKARAEMGLPTNALCLLFGADYGLEKRKGFRELAQALELCWARPEFRRRIEKGEVVLAGFGRPNADLGAMPLPVRMLGYIQEDTAIAKVYSAASYFLLPSLEDNLPNTMLEAMSCGTPVIAFNAGGIPDLVQEAVTGRLAPAGDVRRLSEIICEAAALPLEAVKLGAQCRRLIEAEYALAAQARRYQALYAELLGSRKPSEGLAGGTQATQVPGPGVVLDAHTGPHLATVYDRLRLAALESFAAHLRRASRVEKTICRDLIECLREKIDPGTADAALAERIENLQMELAEADFERLAQKQRRRSHRQQRKEKWRAALGWWVGRKHPENTESLF